MTIQHDQSHDGMDDGGYDGLKQVGVFWSVRILIILLLTSALLYLIAVLPGAPYHIRELFGNSPSLPQAVLFALIVLFALGPPAVMGLQLVRLPSLFVWLFPVGILVHAIIVFLGFRFATPITSVQDLIGENVWAMPNELERLIRFVGLFLMVSLPISGGTALLYGVTRAYAPERVLWWLLFQLMFLLVSYWIVVISAATDNITVLLRSGAGPLAWVGFALWLLSLAFAASVVAERAAHLLKGFLATLFAVVLFLPLSFGILFLSLEPQIGGPQSNLSALDFLFSPGRTAYGVGDAQLFLRYSLAYLATILLLACSQYPAWLAYSKRQSKTMQESPVRPAVGMD